MNHHWYSNGKLLLTGEYLVMFGAKALAMPVKYGQSLDVMEKDEKPSLLFSTSIKGEPWFTSRFNLAGFDFAETNDLPVAGYLQRMLKAARSLNPGFLKEDKAYIANSKINFNIHWGLGSSSSLISNMAWWADVNPYDLNKLISKGSGYDIACARQDTPLIYCLSNDRPMVEPVVFNPPCTEHFWLLYLEKKQSTETNIHRLFSANMKPSALKIAEISDITMAFSAASEASEFSSLIHKHERIIADFLHEETIQSSLFSDFKGAVKSMGAWGGDFCLIVSEEDPTYIREYFEQKGLTTVLPFNDFGLGSLS